MEFFISFKGYVRHKAIILIGPQIIFCFLVFFFFLSIDAYGTWPLVNRYYCLILEKQLPKSRTGLAVRRPTLPEDRGSIISESPVLYVRFLNPRNQLNSVKFLNELVLFSHNCSRQSNPSLQLKNSLYGKHFRNPFLIHSWVYTIIVSWILLFLHVLMSVFPFN